MLRWAAAVGVLCALAMRSASAAPDDYLSRLPQVVQKRLDDLAAARAPKLVPPTPVAVTWKAVRMGSIDLGAPLVAFTAGDLDGDGKPELYAVTAREVVGLALRGGKPVELGRVAFDGERAARAPRDVVGSAVVDGKELVAASSVWAKDLRITLAAGKLTAQPGAAGFLVCSGERWQLVPGRNYFTGELDGARCRRDLVDRGGVPLELRAQLAVTGKLAVEVRRCVPNAACQTAGTYEYAHSGSAFELADVDRDGVPEVIVSGYVAPGDPDTIKVIPVGSDEKKALYQKKFNGGVVGVAVLDRTVVVAVRLAGANRVDLWRLD